MARKNKSPIGDDRKKISFPRIANYSPVLKYFIENGLGAEYIEPPALTKRTLEIGTKYSPDNVCAPFKTTLGSQIEALEAGAQTLIMPMGLCRLGYYGELQEQILRDLGYEFEMVNLAEYSTGKMKDYVKAVHRINPKVKMGKFTRSGFAALKMVEYIDTIEEEYYKNCAFETEKGAYREAYRKFFFTLNMVSSLREAENAYRTCREAFDRIPLDKPQQPIRVGVLGEYYTIMDAFSNLDLEQKLADLGAEVHRWMNLSHRNLHYQGQKNLGVEIQEYCRYEMGPTSTANIWCAKKYAEAGFDGLIHLKSAGCVPEIDVMPVLQNISRDYKIPVLYLSYDSQTSDTGLSTRVEAFYDLMSMRKHVK
ncbi:MAG: hypothetical protein ACOYJJ_02155 [Anaerovoracaceae bacterium]|jgi:predicted nucleotide-binding protein (sugar kinase/HSP70/actin superfamily)